MTPLLWCTLIAIAGLAISGLGILVACVWYDETEKGGWDE